MSAATLCTCVCWELLLVLQQMSRISLETSVLHFAVGLSIDITGQVLNPSPFTCHMVHTPVYHQSKLEYRMRTLPKGAGKKKWNKVSLGKQGAYLWEIQRKYSLLFKL